ncbi:hypothetical protein SAMN04488029_2841 [Reichenbachiella faecimaris]|uniref:Uncharacterized protein n=1 Tax=Reichenbachiella faecimaris TaxID=692418 RepID=A0A1W2GIM8_REIFA|nr:hypothetical protein [Reichenbachiella faecimaris]SMD36342.1 hypothetical protein SAMN04488029_2841 [Reichenbachiella faecimaris]
MKKVLIVIVIGALLAGAAMGGYHLWKQSRITIWSFVPDNSILVFEPNDFTYLWRTDDKRKIVKNLKSLPELDSVQQVISRLDSATNHQFSKVVDQGHLLISFHQNTNESLAALYILEVQELQQHSLLSELQQYLKDSLLFERKERNYQDYIVTEFKKGKTTLTYIFHKNYLIASFSPFLVEDAIRMIADSRVNTYQETERRVAKVAQGNSGAGRCYINTNYLNKLAGIFADPVQIDTTPLKWLTHLMYLDLNIENDKIHLSGFAVNDTSKINYLSAFDGIRGVGFDMKNIVPASTSYVLHASVEDVSQWHVGLKNYWRKHEPAQLTQIGELENRFDFNIRDFYEFMANEVGYFVLESSRSFHSDLIFCIEHKSQELASQFFESLAQKANVDSALYLEQYADRQIKHINIDEIPSRLFGSMYSGFPSAYYFIDGSYVYFGNSQQVLEILIDDIDNENTWRRSVRTNAFLESTHEDGNFSMFVKSSGALNLVGKVLNDNWAEYLEENKTILSQIEYGAVQFTHVDGEYYTSLLLQHPGDLIKQIKPQSFEIQKLQGFANNLISKPFAVRNHNDRTLEMMVQDEAFTLHLLDVNLKPVRQIPLKGKLKSKIYQVDYYKNGKLQYLFALDKTIHMIDRNGTYIPGYPLTLKSDNKIRELSLIDYDKSRNYRIMVADSKGNYYLYNKAGKLLDGWNPKKMGSSPATLGRHVRVQKNDYMLLVQQNGIFQNLTRRGDVRDGFPIDLKGKISQDYFISKGSKPANTEISALTDLGELVSFNLAGVVTNRGQLVRENDQASFHLVNSGTEKEFIVIKKNENELTVFNEALVEQFKVEINAKKLIFQYYYFGIDNQLIIVIDQEKRLGYLYNQDGRLLHESPLEVGHELAVLFQESKGQFDLYCSIGNQLNIVSLKK